MELITIKTEKDIKKLKEGVSYIIEGPVDPFEYLKDLETLQNKIDLYLQNPKKRKWKK